MRKRFLALVMSLIMTCTLLPISAIAEEPTGSEENPMEEEAETTPAEPEELPENTEEDPEEEEPAAPENQVSTQAATPFLTLTIQEKGGDVLCDENGEPYQIQLKRNDVVPNNSDFPYDKKISQAKIWISGFYGSNAAGWHPIVKFRAHVESKGTKDSTIRVDSVTITNKDMSNARADRNTSDRYTPYDYVSIDEYTGKTPGYLTAGLKKTVTVVGVQPMPQFDPGKLTFSLTSSASTVALRNGIYQTITVTNTDAMPGKSIKVTDILPEGLTYGNYSAIQLTGDKKAKSVTPEGAGQALTWTIDKLPEGSTATITLMVRGAKLGSCTNTASIVGGNERQTASVDIDVYPQKLRMTVGTDRDTINNFGLKAEIRCQRSHAAATYGVSYNVGIGVEIGDVEKIEGDGYYSTLTVLGSRFLDQYNNTTYAGHTLQESDKTVKLKYNEADSKWEVNDPADKIVHFTAIPETSEEKPEKTTNQTVYLGADGLIGQQYSNIYYGRYQQQLLAKGENVEKPAGYDDADLYYGKSFVSTQKWEDGVVPAYYLIQPVKWRLLSNEDDNLFLLSDQVLDTGCYNESHMNEGTKTDKHPNPHWTTWKTSRLRAFLNNEKGTWCFGGSDLNDDDAYERLVTLDYTQNGFLKNAFSAGEQDAIAQTELTEDGNSSISSESKVFALSEKDTTWRGGYGFTSKESTLASPTDYVLDGGYMTQEWTSEFWNYRFYFPQSWPWWTRTQGAYSFRVKYSGSMSSQRETTAQEWLGGIRPAFNIDKAKVLMATPADEAKTTAVNSVLAGTIAAGDPGNDWRLTILDAETFGSFDAQLHDKEKTSAVAGETVKIDFTGAQTGADEYVSAVIADRDGNALYYGHISKNAADGTAGVTLPADLEPDEYRLLIFNEHCNEAYNTDFGSNFFEFTLTVRQGEHFPVTYDANGGENAPADQVKIEDVSLTLSTERPTREDYAFTGWNTTADGSGTSYAPGAAYALNAPLTLFAQWRKSSSNDSDSSGPSYYFAIRKVDAEDGHALNGAAFALYQKDSKGSIINRTVSKTMRRNGQDGIALFSVDTKGTWYYTETSAPDGYVRDSTEYRVTVQETGSTAAIRNAEDVKNYRSSTPGMLNDTDHFAYVIGYRDGLVKPYGLISRAETTTIFFRLLKDEVRDSNLLTSNTYADVADDYWANTAISTMTGLGIVQGRTATTFDPRAPITRAQFAAICARFDTGKSSGTQTFSDISGHWAEKYIQRAAELGWIKGFEDGTFRPDTYITRAQAMTMINRVLNRIPEDTDDLLDDMNVWPDCNPGDWFYLAVQEATNSHDFRHKGGNYETWTEMNEDPDWTRYEN